MTHVRKVPKFLVKLSALMALMAVASAAAAAGEGLRLDTNTMPRWQARLQLSSLDPNASTLDGQRASGARILSANLLGDYYFTGSGLGGVRGGLRATGGMLLGSPSLAQSSSGLALGLNSSFQFGQRSLSMLTPNLDGNDVGSSQSYLGIGYTGHAMRSGLSFSADLGLVNNMSLSGLRLGRSSAAGMDDVLRDLRYKPVLQLGLSYSY